MIHGESPDRLQFAALTRVIHDESPDPTTLFWMWCFQLATKASIALVRDSAIHGESPGRMCSPFSDNARPEICG